MLQAGLLALLLIWQWRAIPKLLPLPRGKSAGAIRSSGLELKEEA